MLHESDRYIDPSKQTNRISPRNGGTTTNMSLGNRILSVGENRRHILHNCGHPRLPTNSQLAAMDSNGLDKT